MDYLSVNRAAYDKLVRDGAVFARCASDEECRNPLGTLDSRGWLPKSVVGLNVLCLAAAGGWQAILYATAGAKVTVVDLSPEMLALDHREAKKRSLSIQLIEGSMDKLEMLGDARFDIVHHPVSTCYVPQVQPVFDEVGRVLKDDGIYISQHKTPTSLQIVDRNERDQYIIGLSYYHEGALPRVNDQAYRESGAVEYLHRWEQIVGGICRSNMVIEALSEPKRGNPDAKPGDFRHRGFYVAPYLRIKAKRVPRETPPNQSLIYL